MDKYVGQFRSDVEECLLGDFALCTSFFSFLFPNKYPIPIPTLCMHCPVPPHSFNFSPMTQFSERTPGSFIEERGASVVWRFWTGETMDHPDRQWARRQAAEAQNHIYDR